MKKEIERFIENQKEYVEEHSKNYYERDNAKIKKIELEQHIIENNIIKTFIDDNFDSIIETLKKYQNKRIGEKTKEKIENDIKSINNLFEFVSIRHGYYSWDSNDYELTIWLKSDLFKHNLPKIEIDFDYRKKSAYTDESEYEYQISINGYNKERYNYIENINILSDNIIKESNQLKEEIEETKKELNNKITNFRDKYNYIITKETITFKYL